ncbi:MAG: hypothetical protein IJF12_02145 [Alphaproteobacteria bacterium]|nr:hypothetical protein [Alphaproteobacteria bacterium]
MKYTNENGRSMVEMLGVLAIIGVLSVGGIAGYSKAMNKFKINKTTDQVSMLIANIRTMFSAQGDYAGLTNGAAIKFGIVPDDMYTASTDGAYADTYTINNAFNGTVEIKSSTSNGTDTAGAFTVAYKGLTQEACVTLATSDWGSGQASGLIAILAGSGLQDTDLAGAVIGGDGSSAAGKAIGQPGATGTDAVKTPMPVAAAVTGCASNATANQVVWKYY